MCDGPEELDITASDVIADQAVLGEGDEVGDCSFSVDYEEWREDDQSGEE